MAPNSNIRHATSSTVGFADFQRTKYFPQLDGLRGLSILMVLTFHAQLTPLHQLNGHTGVTVFFVISGFIITLLLLREEESHGRVNLTAFYIRRAFRLLPIYLLALAATTLGVVLGLAENPGDYWSRMLYFLTFTNEFAPAGTFGHTWSLAVEEKFYFAWPLVAFAVPMRIRWRIAIASVLVALTSALGLVPTSFGYFGVYAPILFGCLFALIAHRASGYRVIRQFARPAPGLLFLALTVAAIWVAPQSTTQVLVGAALFCLFPFALLGALRTPLSARWLVWAGKRAYAVYLFHLLVSSAVSVLIPTDTVWQGVLHLVAMTVLSFLLAEVVYRLVELPFIKYGRKLSGRHIAKVQARARAKAAERSATAASTGITQG